MSGVFRNEVPHGWVRAPLEEFCQIVQGQSPPGRTYNSTGQGLPFFQGKAEFGDLYPTAVKWCSAPKKAAQPNDILISIRAPVGPTNLCPDVACIGRGLAAIRPLGGVLPKYVLYGIRNTDKELVRRSTGSTFDAVSGNAIRQHPLPLAPVDEQRRIVAEIEKQFTRLEAGVQAVKRVKANLKRYRASVLKAACEGRLVPTEAELARAERRDYEPAEKLLARILKERRARWEADQLAKMHAAGKPPKDDKWKAKYKEPAAPDTTNLPCLPEGWVWAVLGCLADVHLGKMLSPKAYETGLQQLPYLRNENVQWGRIDTIDVKMMGFNQQELERYCVETNHLLVCEGGEAGRAAVYAGPSGEFMYQKALHRVRPIAGLVSPYFIQFCFWHYVVSGVVIPRPSETTIQHLPLERMVVLPIPLPPLAEQRRIVAEVERRLSVIDELEAAVEANLKRAERLGQAILKRAFEGRLVPQDPSDEPASVLLERIRAERRGGSQTRPGST